jgi:hypothetical protein
VSGVRISWASSAKVVSMARRRGAADLPRRARLADEAFLFVGIE